MIFLGQNSFLKLTGTQLVNMTACTTVSFNPLSTTALRGCAPHAVLHSFFLSSASTFSSSQLEFLNLLFASNDIRPIQLNCFLGILSKRMSPMFVLLIILLTLIWRSGCNNGYSKSRYTKCNIVLHSGCGLMAPTLCRHPGSIHCSITDFLQ